jgi:hypothetical protein
MAYTIICADCREPRVAAKRNTKYCHHCRLLRNLEFFATRTHVCGEANCDRKFAPIERSDAWCSQHALGYSTLKGLCLMCKNDDAFLVRPGVRVCVGCVRKPALRRGLIRNLQRSQHARRTANAELSDAELRRRIDEAVLPSKETNA